MFFTKCFLGEFRFQEEPAFNNDRLTFKQAVEDLCKLPGLHTRAHISLLKGRVVDGNEHKMFKMVESKIRKNVSLVLKHSKKERKKPRDIALEIARKRVRKKCKTCRI